MLRIAFLSIFICAFPSWPPVHSARILGVFPMPSISHQVVFRALTFELASRGHELVVLTPDPAFRNKQHKYNITEIDTGESYQKWMQLLQTCHEQRSLKRGVIMDIHAMTSNDLLKGFVDLFVYQFDMPAVKTILDDKSKKFDLVILESIMNYPLILGHLVNAPIIHFSSYYGSSENFEVIGAPSWHPLYYPSTYRRKFRNLSFWEKIQEAYEEWRIYSVLKKGEDLENEYLKENFGCDAPTVSELQKNIHALFLNAHPIFGNNRPVPPNVVYLGGLHLQPVKPLPEELKSYLDNSKRGVIYVSLGTNVKPSMMDQDFLEAFLDAFKALPYDILWKFDGDNLGNVPENVKFQKWFPQRDLLMHPNIKLFVMQGGLQSTDEAIEAGVPLVGIPILGDQWYNVNKYVELGIGVEVDAETMTANDLINAVQTVLEDESYRRNMEKLQALVKDQPQKPLERAVWWTEHVLRHKGGLHFRGPAANKTWSDYYMVDVIVTVAGVVFAIAVIVCVSLWKVAITLRSKRNIKSKIN